MPDEYWENLKEIFHAALALSSQERATYLDQACNGSLSLRETVESLLKSHEETANFVDTPAYQAAAEMFLEGMELRSGQTVTHYSFAPGRRRHGQSLFGRRYQVAAQSVAEIPLD